MGVASNTKDCFRACIGKRVVWCLFDALPAARLDLAAGTKTLIFDDGTGLTITESGAYWLDSTEEVKLAINAARARLESLRVDIADVLATAGALPK